MHAIIVNKLTDILVDLSGIMRVKIHQCIPVGAETIRCKSSLHLLRIEEVKVSAEKLSSIRQINSVRNVKLTSDIHHPLGLGHRYCAGVKITASSSYLF